METFYLECPTCQQFRPVQGAREQAITKPWRDEQRRALASQCERPSDDVGLVYAV